MIFLIVILESQFFFLFFSLSLSPLFFNSFHHFPCYFSSLLVFFFLSLLPYFHRLDSVNLKCDHSLQTLSTLLTPAPSSEFTGRNLHQVLPCTATFLKRIHRFSNNGGRFHTDFVINFKWVLSCPQQFQ